MNDILKIAFQELGTSEIAGSNNNPRILNYAHETSMQWVTNDEIPWCSIFINWCTMKANLPYTKLANARSWLNIGIKVDQPEPGDVVIFWRESIQSQKGHVALFLGFNESGEKIYVIGGNQGNKVSVEPYTSDRILGFQRLIKNETTFAPEPTLQKGDRGEKVKQLQKALLTVKINIGRADGIYGQQTYNGVKALQSTNNHTAIDGIYGQQSYNLLQSLLQQ